MQKLTNNGNKINYQSMAQKKLNEIWNNGSGLKMRQIYSFLTESGISHKRFFELMTGMREASDIEMIYIDQLIANDKKKEDYAEYWIDCPSYAELTNYADKHGV